MLGAYVAFTHAVATFSVLKGTYLSAATTAFVIFASVGLDRAARRGAWARRAVSGTVLAFVLSSSAISWYGWLATPTLNPADYYLRAYTDEPTERAFRYFVERDPR